MRQMVGIIDLLILFIVLILTEPLYGGDKTELDQRQECKVSTVNDSDPASNIDAFHRSGQEIPFGSTLRADFHCPLLFLLGKTVLTIYYWFVPSDPPLKGGEPPSDDSDSTPQPWRENADDNGWENAT
jgi:hypothetical protein